MKVGVVGDIHPDGYEIFHKNNIEYVIANNTEEEYLMVGDSEVDSTFARKNNIECILVKF